MAPKLATPVPIILVVLAAERENPFKSSEPPLETVSNPDAEPKADVLPSFKVPAPIKVCPA